LPAGKRQVIDCISVPTTLMIEVIIIPMWRCAVCGLLYDGGEPFFGSSPSRRSECHEQEQVGMTPPVPAPRYCLDMMVNTTLPDRSG